MSPCCPHVLGSVIHTKTAFTYTYQTQKKMSEDNMTTSRYDFENSFKVKTTSNTEKDKCVKCGEITMYEKHVHIDNRTGYIEGAGQLCNNCFIQATW